VVYRSSNPYRVEIVKAKLEEFDINAVLLNKKDSNYHFGSYEVCVSPDQVLKSIKLLEKEIKFE
jgi:hypothetical protein